MNRIFRKQLFLLIPLLLVSFATTFANNNSEDFSILQNIEIQNFDNSTQETDYTCTPYQQEHRNLLFLEIIDLRDSEENEEKYHSNKKNSKQGNYLTASCHHYYTTYSFYTFLKKPKHFQYSFINTSRKLHLMFQVFII
ncbi:MAG: hypothetical protein ACJA1B_001724 [Polaribacter sp.]|jgi:hypothetical protein